MFLLETGHLWLIDMAGALLGDPVNTMTTLGGISSLASRKGVFMCRINSADEERQNNMEVYSYIILQKHILPVILISNRKF